MSDSVKKALCPGSFDPPTVGHTDVIRRAAGLFDSVTALVCVNSAKRGLFTPDERAELLKDALKDIPNVNIEFYNGLLVDYVAENGFDAIVKGIRNTKDYTYENEIAEVNRSLVGKLCRKPCETVFLLSKPETAHVSSTIVRELLSFSAPVDEYVDNPGLLYKMYAKRNSESSR